MRQATVETTTYGSELVTAKTATEQIVPIMTKAYMFGDNKSVVMTSTSLHPS